MKFEYLKPMDAEGWRLAHSVVVNGFKMTKGAIVSREHIEAMISGAIEAIQVYQLDPDDIGEDQAAQEIAHQISGDNIIARPAIKGRVDLVAEQSGLLSISDTFSTINKLHEGITVATRANQSRVDAGQLIASVKIIPYGLPKSLAQLDPSIDAKLSLFPFKPYRASLVHSDADKNLNQIIQRVEGTIGNIVRRIAVEHSIDAIHDAIRETIREDKPDIILIVGKAAIADRKDIVPAALTLAGGTVHHLGMPVDPGNLLMLGEIEKTMVIGVPSCAKSPTPNGFDMVIERFSARGDIDVGDIQDMGIGGLLKHPAPRRQENIRRSPKAPTIATVVLAAGASSRAGINKLLAQINGETIVAKTVDALLHAQRTVSSQTVIVTGRDSESVIKSLKNKRLHTVFNRNYNDGIASSLRCGLNEVDNTSQYILIALGDMPFVQTNTINTLCAKAQSDSQHDIFVPTFNGKRGNPVLWRHSMLERMRNLEGDLGGKQLMKLYPDQIKEVAVNDPGILIDLDTQEALAQFGAVDNIHQTLE